MIGSSIGQVANRVRLRWLKCVRCAGATRQLDAGRVFTFCDEWVTYTSQWDGTGAETCATDPAHNLCTGRTADVYYQVPQFWYNAIRWASGDKDCFYIEDVVR